jgi:hypothetical protein
MAIEKLERYELDDKLAAQYSGVMQERTEGEYVLYDAARAREDALLKAMHRLIKNVIFCPSFVIDDTESIIRDIEATR